MKHYGDITKINGAEVEPVDIICGGSPCQDLSVAGKRAGLAGERSGLFMEQIRIVKEMRENDRRNGKTDTSIRPRFLVWENVCGAFSSGTPKGEDFRIVLEEICRIKDKDAVVPQPPKGKWQPSGCIMGDGWSIAWRVHDAQFWGVPQRRKRIALVADFAGGAAAEILFEREGVSGNTAESREQGQSSATDVGSGVEETGRVAISFQEQAGKPGGGKGILIQNERTGALSTLNNQSVCISIRNGQLHDAISPSVEVSKTLNCMDDPAKIMVLNDQGGSRMGISEDVSGTLRAQEHGHAPIVYGISAYDSNSMKSSNPHSGIYEADTARTLDLNGGSPACNQGGMAVVQAAGVDTYNQTMDDEIAQPLRAADGGDSTPKVVCIEGNGQRESHKGDGYKESETMYMLNTIERHAVCVENHPADSRVKVSDDGMVQTLSSRMGTGGGNVPMVMEPTVASKASYFMKTHDDGKAETLVATDYKDPRLVAYESYQNVTGTVDACIGKGTSNQLAHNDMFVANGYIVRRLTPLECERLQGFPDHWTDIGEWVDSKGKKHKDADSPRYKALGNSIALPFWEWMAKRMVKYLDDEPTMASLFDGIGGFPLVYQRAGCEPIWASEIEEFPIAVTKLRFMEE